MQGLSLGIHFHSIRQYTGCKVYKDNNTYCARVRCEGIGIAPIAAPPTQEHFKSRTPPSNLKLFEETKAARPVFNESKLLSELSTWGVGGPAKYFIEVCSETDLIQVLR